MAGNILSRIINSVKPVQIYECKPWIIISTASNYSLILSTRAINMQVINSAWIVHMYGHACNNPIRTKRPGKSCLRNARLVFGLEEI